MSKPPQKLLDYPFVVVRIDCTLCPRKGSYRLVRLAERFGSDATLREVLDAIAFDCKWSPSPHRRRPPRKYEVRCGARFQDIDGITRRDADIPVELKREALTVIAGGRQDV